MFLNNVFKYLCIYIIIKGNLVVNSSRYDEDESRYGKRQDQLLDDHENFPYTEEYEWNHNRDPVLSEFEWLDHSSPSSTQDEWRIYDDSKKSPFEIMKTDYVDILTENSDGTKLVKNDVTKYQLSSDGFAFFYKFKDDANCVIISYSEKLIWDRNVEDVKYSRPKVLCFHSDLLMIFIEFEDVLRMYKLANEFFILLSERELNGFNSSNLELMIKDPNNPLNTIPINEGQYAENCHGFENQYEFQYNIVCTEVKYKGVTVWKHDEKENNIKPNSVFFNMYTKMIVVDFPHHYMMYQLIGDNWKFLTKNSLETYSKNDLTFYYNKLEIDDFNYDLLDYGDGLTYVYMFNDVECTDVKYKNVSLMMSKNFIVKSVYVNLYEKMLMISGIKNMLVYMYIDGWNLIFSYPEDREKEYISKIDKIEEKLREARLHKLTSRDKSSRIRPNKTKTLIITSGVGVSLVLIFLLLYFSLK